MDNEAFTEILCAALIAHLRARNVKEFTVSKEEMRAAENQECVLIIDGTPDAVTISVMTETEAAARYPADTACCCEGACEECICEKKNEGN